jgi:hypothetical protein
MSSPVRPNDTPEAQLRSLIVKFDPGQQRLIGPVFRCHPWVAAISSSRRLV